MHLQKKSSFSPGRHVLRRDVMAAATPNHSSNLAPDLTESFHTCTRIARQCGFHLYSTRQSSGSQAQAWENRSKYSSMGVFLCERINFIEMDHFVAVPSVYVLCRQATQDLMKWVCCWCVCVINSLRFEHTTSQCKVCVRLDFPLSDWGLQVFCLHI